MTDVTPYVSRLLIYPIKALDALPVEQVTVLASGALNRDRQFALVDEAGRFVNGKRNNRVHALRTHYDLETNTVLISIQKPEPTATFQLNQDRAAFEQWLSDYFGFRVQIQQNLEMGFPDDTVSPGPTIVSTATLEAIASWYPGLTTDEVRLRFRSNIEIAGVPAFWEDRLFSQAEQTVAFQIGDVEFAGVNPCQRCVVVTRNPKTGDAYPNFQKLFVTKRQETFPDWTERSRFNHFFRLAINTRIAPSELGKAIVLGDPVRL